MLPSVQLAKAPAQLPSAFRREAMALHRPPGLPSGGPAQRRHDDERKTPLWLLLSTVFFTNSLRNRCLSKPLPEKVPHAHNGVGLRGAPSAAVRVPSPVRSGGDSEDTKCGRCHIQPYTPGFTGKREGHHLNPHLLLLPEMPSVISSLQHKCFGGGQGVNLQAFR